MPLGAIYVGRGSRWGNPFIVGQHGTRAECVELFRKLVVDGLLCISIDRKTAMVQKELLYQVTYDLEELRGHDLACWCPLDDKPCHADVYLEIANR